MRTPVGDAPLIPTALIITGGYLTWFGVHYWRSANVKWPSDPIKAILTGKGLPVADHPPSARSVLAQNLASVGAGAAAAGAAAGVSATGSQIADDALKYQGQGYVFGGNADRPGNWDCSSFVSYVLGHDLHLPLPGGKWGDPGFPPHSHGPTAAIYRMYGTPINRGQVQAGDIIAWSDHVAIATSATDAISAHSPSIGTTVTNIDKENSYHGGNASFRRV
jgi:cell wall-associated NlpC family hydrolase